MVIQNYKNENGMYTFNYECTYRMYWELMLHFMIDLLRDMKLQDICVIDTFSKKQMSCKSELETFKNDIWKCPTLLKENGALLINGYNNLLKIDMQVIVYNQLKTLILSVIHSRGQEDMVEKYGKDVFTPYMDSVEINAYKSLIKGDFKDFLSFLNDKGHGNLFEEFKQARQSRK